MRPRGILLDLDDTLIDHAGAVGRALTAWLPALGVTVTPAITDAWNAAAEKHLIAWRERRVTFQEQRRLRLRDFLPFLGIPFAESELDTIFQGFLLAYESSWALFPDTIPALDAIAAAGLPTAVFTNGSTEQQNKKLARVGLTGRVGPVFTPEDLGVAKPEPAAFALACARWGLDPATVISVGDRHDLDIAPARLAGLRAVHLDRHDRGPRDESSRITSLASLPGYW